jgi:hypothetical protein
VGVDLDTGAQVNTVSRAFVRKHKLRPVTVPLPKLRGAQGASIKCYGAYLLPVSMTDHWGATDKW